MRIRLLNAAGARQLYESRMARDFPPGELKPFAAMEELLAAGLYGALTAALKVKFGTNETLMTLMLNYVALYFLTFLGET